METEETMQFVMPFLTDGIHFTRNATNPIFHPSGVTGIVVGPLMPKCFGSTINTLLFFASRDPEFKIQIQGVASAPGNTGFNREDWTQLTDYPILKPEFPWEGACIEASVNCSAG